MKLNFESQLLVSDKNIHELEKIESFLRGMIKSNPDCVIEKYKEDLSNAIYYVKQLKKYIEENDIELK